MGSAVSKDYDRLLSFLFLAELALAARLNKCRRFLFFVPVCSRQIVNHGPRRWSEVSPIC